MKRDDLKGLRVYLIVVLVGLSFFAYAQSIGWKWVGATNTEPPDGQQQHGYRYRYFYHK